MMKKTHTHTSLKCMPAGQPPATKSLRDRHERCQARAPHFVRVLCDLAKRFLGHVGKIPLGFHGNGWHCTSPPLRGRSPCSRGNISYRMRCTAHLPPMCIARPARVHVSIRCCSCHSCSASQNLCAPPKKLIHSQTRSPWTTAASHHEPLLTYTHVLPAPITHAMTRNRQSSNTVLS